MATGMFWGVGVGPGPAGLIPIAAVEALQEADVIIAPRAKSGERSLARHCLAGVALDESRIRELSFNMESDRSQTLTYYEEIAAEIARDLNAGKNVAYLTIGDSLTYSTYSYLLEALLHLVPDLHHKTFPGVTSYATIAACLDWPLGQGKERVLILPCPDDATTLKNELLSHDIVVLMKIGSRLAMVLDVVRELSLEHNCAFGSRVGSSEELVSRDLDQFANATNPGYLTTMLIRCARVADGLTSRGGMYAARGEAASLRAAYMPPLRNHSASSVDVPEPVTTKQGASV